MPLLGAGEWLDFLGMKDSAKYVGTPQSVAIRIPDCSVTTHLIDLVSPSTPAQRPEPSFGRGWGLQAAGRVFMAAKRGRGATIKSGNEENALDRHSFISSIEHCWKHGLV